MADPNEVKLFKQYLTETKAFQPLVKVFSLLRLADPKPTDPIKFIRDQLGGLSIDMEEFNGLKQNVIQLNEDMRQIKGELTEIKSMMPTLAKPHDAPIDDTKISDHHNDSNQSMENNVGDSNYASMLNESDVLDSTADQTIINMMEHDSIEQANNLSTEEPQNDITGDGFTMEFVEVDVVLQTSLDLEQTIHMEKDTVDSAQNDGTISNLGTITSHPKMTLPNTNDSITFGDFGESQSEGTCNSDVADQSPATESIAIENGASHAMNAAIKIEDVQINDTDLKSIDCQSASTPKKLSDETNIDAVDVKMDIKIEDLPIIMKSDDSEDQLVSSQQSFHGFDVHDVEQSEKRWLSKVELSDNNALPQIPEIDEMDLDSTIVYSICVTEPLPNKVNESDEQTDNADMNHSDEQKLIVGEILGEVVDTIVQDGKVCIDSEAATKGDATTEVANQIGIESISMPKDDPETAFFLSLSK